MKTAVIVFPGSNCDRDVQVALRQSMGSEPTMVWHGDSAVPDVDLIVVPGRLSYGDYLRPVAMARVSPVMDAVRRFAQDGGLVIGICNGFQILCEAQLLPGILLRNNHLEYRCQWTNLRTEQVDTPFTRRCQPGQVLQVPVSHGEGNYFAEPATLHDLEARGQVLFRYCEPTGDVTAESNPNGAANNIAGIVNRQGNVLGLMPHPERCCEPVLGGTDGNFIFQSIIDSCGSR